MWLVLLLGACGNEAAEPECMSGFVWDGDACTQVDTTPPAAGTAGGVGTGGVGTGSGSATGGTTPTDTAPSTGDSGDPTTGPNPFDATHVTFEFDGILRADGSLDGYWDTDSAHEHPEDWNPPLITIRFGDEVLFGGGGGAEEVDAHTCEVEAEYRYEREPALPVDRATTLFGGSYEGWLNVFYYDPGGGYGVTFTDCDDELDEDTWGAEGRDLWQAFDGARFGLAFGPIEDTDLRDYWSANSLEDYGHALVASYLAVNSRGEGDTLVYQGEPHTSCLLFEYDAATGELSDPDDDGNLELIDVSDHAAGAPLPEAYVRCFAYRWPEIADIDLTRLTEGANGGPDGG